MEFLEPLTDTIYGKDKGNDGIVSSYEMPTGMLEKLYCGKYQRPTDLIVDLY